MKIPEKVKVGGATYTVKIVDNIVDSQILDGRIDYLNQVIEIKKVECAENMYQTFLHELVHALNLHMGYLHAECAPSEEEVERLANTLYMVIADNPGIFESSKETVVTVYYADDEPCFKQTVNFRTGETT